MQKTFDVHFEELLALEGLHSALLFLNQRVPHRFTAIYRIDRNDLEIVELIDKLNDPQTAPQSRVPFENSFCEVAVQDGLLSTSNSAVDPKLDGRTYQGVITSYVGLPLLNSDGTLYGTLCHCDYREQTISNDEFDFLQKATVLIPTSRKTL